MACLMFTILTLVLLCVIPICSEDVLYVHRYSAITVIPADIPSNVTILYLTDNRITKVPALAFSSYIFLIELDLSRNKINSISREVFHGCQIERLNLRVNNIAANELLSLESLNQTLIFLDISSNPIDFSDDVWVTLLLNLTALSDVSLRTMSLTFSTFPVFPHNKRARYIDLNGNRMTTLPNGRFAGFQSLSYLASRSNKLNSFPDFSLLGENNSLAELNLWDNHISRIERRDRMYIPHLEELFTAQ